MLDDEDGLLSGNCLVMPPALVRTISQGLEKELRNDIQTANDPAADGELCICPGTLVASYD